MNQVWSEVGRLLAEQSDWLISLSLLAMYCTAAVWLRLSSSPIVVRSVGLDPSCSVWIAFECGFDSGFPALEPSVFDLIGTLPE